MKEERKRTRSKADYNRLAGIGPELAEFVTEFIELQVQQGLVAGAMSIAAGEYVSVESQADTEGADIERERHELGAHPQRKLAELTSIYVSHWLDPPLARLVAKKMMSGDALGTHTRDELGITQALRARLVQAAFASAISFAVGAIVPIAAVLLAPSVWVTEVSSATALTTLVILGAPPHTQVTRLLSGVQCEFPFGEHSQWGSPRALETSSARLYR